MLECAYSLNSLTTENCDLKKPMVRKIAVDYVSTVQMFSTEQNDNTNSVLYSCAGTPF